MQSCVAQDVEISFRSYQLQKCIYLRRSCGVKFSDLQRAVGNRGALGSWRSYHGKSKKNKIKFQIVYTKIKVSSGAAVSKQFFYVMVC